MEKKHIWWVIGIACIIFLFIFLATRPRWCSEFDFSGTGNIGDTIGGLSAPIIGILGSYLVYISFNEQKKANDKQIEALNDEKKRLKAERWYQFNIKRYQDLEDRLNNIEIIVLKKNTDEDLLYNMEPVIFKGFSSFIVLIDLLNNKKDKSFTKNENFTIDTYIFDLIHIIVNAFEILNELQIDIEYHFDEAKEIYENIQSIKFLQRDFLINPIIDLLEDGTPIKNELKEQYEILIKEITELGINHFNNKK